jgi:hypothetical protein
VQQTEDLIVRLRERFAAILTPVEQPLSDTQRLADIIRAWHVKPPPAKKMGLIYCPDNYETAANALALVLGKEQQCTATDWGNMKFRLQSRGMKVADLDNRPPCAMVVITGEPSLPEMSHANATGCASILVCTGVPPVSWHNLADYEYLVKPDDYPLTQHPSDATQATRVKPPVSVDAQRLADVLRVWHAKPLAEKKQGRIRCPDGYETAYDAIALVLGHEQSCAATPWESTLTRLRNKGVTVFPLEDRPKCNMVVITGYPSPAELKCAAATGCASILIISKMTPLCGDEYDWLNPATPVAPVKVVKPPAPTLLADPLSDFLTCPVCCEIAEPPWLSCTNGHIICAPCHRGLTGHTKKCPTCRVAVDTLVKQRLAVDIVRHFKCPLELPCRNDGCGVRVPWDMMDAHKSICAHRPYMCPVGIIGGTCRWEGPVAEMQAHFASHKVMILQDDPVILLAKEHAMSETYWYLPAQNVLAGIVPMDFRDTKDLDTRRIWFFSLNPGPVRLRVTCANSRIDFDLAVTLAAPSLLEHEDSPGKRGDSYFINQHLHSNVSVPVFKRDVTMVRMAAVVAKREREEGDAVDLPPAKVVCIDSSSSSAADGESVADDSDSEM